MSFLQPYTLSGATLCLGTVSQSNTFPTFNPIGDGATTGFANIPITLPKAGNYSLQFQISLLSASAPSTVVAVRILDGGVSITNSYNQFELGTGTGCTVVAAFGGAFTVGLHNFNMEWTKITGGNPTVTGGQSALGFAATLISP